MAEGGGKPTSRPGKGRRDRAEASCTVDELRGLLVLQSGGEVLPPTNDCDLVSPGIYIGNGKVARSKDKLKTLGVTHVLNAARGPNDSYHVHTSHVMYRPWGMAFLGVEATDMPSFKLNQHFKRASEFIDECLQNGGRVLVHCVEGRSRSATLVLAYLMSHRHMDVRAAVREVRRGREIYPNEGFLQQLCHLNDQLLRRGVTLS